jgi:hypothetical protein
MKIITNDAVYVQKNDIALLNSDFDLPIPASIFNKVYGNGIVIIDDQNRYDFVKFEEKSEIEFFKGIDWMIDFNEVKDLNEEEFFSLGQSILDEKNTIARKFNAMSAKEKKKNMHMYTQCELLDFKIYSLRDILWFKQGFIKMTLPDDIDYSVNHIQENVFKRTLKKIFNKR